MSLIGFSKSTPDSNAPEHFVATPRRRRRKPKLLVEQLEDALIGLRWTD